MPEGTLYYDDTCYSRSMIEKVIQFLDKFCLDYYFYAPRFVDRRT